MTRLKKRVMRLVSACGGVLGFEIVDERDEVVDMHELAKAQWKQMQKEQHEQAAQAAAYAKGGVPLS